MGFVARLLIVVIGGYRYTLAYFLGGRCRFYPSCSEYAVGAIERFGAIKGAYLSVRRIARCHPGYEGGMDPVPHSLSASAKRESSLSI